MRSYRNLVIIVLALLLVGGGLAIWNANREIPDRESPFESPVPQGQDPEVIGRNVSFIVTEGEIKKWKIEAVQAIYNDTRTEARLSDVHGEFYDQDGKPVLQFTAPTGEYTNRNNAVVLTGGVVAKSTKKDGGELRAPRMVWDAKSTEVVASGGAEMIFAMGTSKAQVCRFTLDFSKVFLEGGVTSVIQP